MANCATPTSSVRGILALGLVGLLSAGCLQIETLVELHENGSATITERMNFSRSLLNMAAAEKEDGLVLIPLLQKDAALRRMKEMGQGVTLASHEVREGEQGSMESVTVFKVADLDGFRYVSPWLAYGDFPDNSVIEWKLVPMYANRPYGRKGTGGAGTLIARAVFPDGRPQRVPGEVSDAPVSPAESQVFRELGPVFRDMLRDFKVRLTFRSYAPVFYGGNTRETRVLSPSVDLIHVTDRDMDRQGYGFFENEEIMLDLLRGRLGSEEVVRHLRVYGSNLTVPVMTPYGSAHMWGIGHGTGAHDIYFSPSRPLFDRFFKGKTLDFSQQHYRPGGLKNYKDVPATWELIGFVPVGDGR